MSETRNTNFRWVIIGLLFFITAVNYIDRASISYAIDGIAKTFHLNDTDIGLILGAFGVGYVCTTLLGGISVDRYGPKRTMLIAVVFWSLALLLTGISTGFFMLFVARVVLGIGEGPNFPALTRVVSDWLSVRERTRALSYALIAVPVGLAIGAPVVSILITQYSWRVMFFILGALAIVWLPFWYFLFRDLPEDSSYVTQKELSHIHDEKPQHDISVKSVQARRRNVEGLWKFLLTNPTLITNYWAFFVFGYYLFFFMNWLPTYLAQSYHLQLEKLGLFSILPWSLAALFMWGAGVLSDKIYEKTGNYRASRTHLIWMTQLLAGACILPIIFIHNLYIALIFISLAVAFILSANGAYYAVNIDMAKERSGTALGIMDAAFAISGFVAPVITGWSVTVTGHFMAAFIVLAVLSLSSVIVLLIFHRPTAQTKYIFNPSTSKRKIK